MRRTLGRIETQYDDDSMYTASFNSAANIHKPGLKGKVKDLGGWLSKGLTLTDSQAIDTIILGAYAQITAENPSMSKEKAIHYAGNLAVMATNLTQVSSETAHMSPIRSSKSAIARVLSFMTGATSQAWNVAERRYSALRHAIATGDKQEMAAAYGKMLISGTCIGSTGSCYRGSENTKE